MSSFSRHFSFDPQLVRSKRKTLSIEINTKGIVVIRSPLKLSSSVIEKFILEKEQWIEKSLLKQKEFLDQRNSFLKLFNEGEQFLFLGEEFPLVYKEFLSPSFQFSEAFYIDSNRKHFSKKYFLHWYKKQANNIFEERLKKYSEEMNLSFRRLAVSTAKTQWGCCTGRDDIFLNWRLVMSPLWVIDYVVVHELAHLVHRNHGKLFWRKVEKYYPEHKRARGWLRRNGDKLMYAFE